MLSPDQALMVNATKSLEASSVVLIVIDGGKCIPYVCTDSSHEHADQDVSTEVMDWFDDAFSDGD